MPWLAISKKKVQFSCLPPWFREKTSFSGRYSKNYHFNSLKLEIQMNSLKSKGIRIDHPKICHKDCFDLKAIKKTENTERDLCHSPIKEGQNFPVVKVFPFPSLIPERKTAIITGNVVSTKMDLHKQISLKSSYLPWVSLKCLPSFKLLLTNPNPFSFVLTLLHKIIILR